jgi:succinoglycan biosynthesis protein ExoO
MSEPFPACASDLPARQTARLRGTSTLTAEVEISVVIPVFNGADSIVRAIASVQAQTRRDLEIIVVDDFSTDDSCAIVDAIAQQDPRVRLIRSAANGGPSAARNLGFAAARGQWIAILDGDDAYLPDRLEALVTLADRNALDMIADGVIYYDHHAGQEVRTVSPTSQEVERLDMDAYLRANAFRLPLTDFSGAPIQQHALLKFLFRRSFLTQSGLRYDERYRDNEDFIFYAECLMHGARAALTSRAFYIYSQRIGALSGVASTVARTPRDRRNVIRAGHELLERYGARWTALQRRLMAARMRQAVGLQAIERARYLRSTGKALPALGAIAGNPPAWPYIFQAVMRRLLRRGE